jgi:hypothetical protein
LPGRQHLHPEDIKKLLPYVWLLDVEGEPGDYRYRLIGTGVVNWVGGDYTGKRMREVHPNFDTNPGQIDFLKPVVERHEPHWYRGPPRVYHHKEVADLENLILPLATDGETVDMVLGSTVFYGHDGTQIL